MLKSLFRRGKITRASEIYELLVARARHEDFYLKNIVPDTFDGRFEMMVMHLYLIHTRLKNANEDGRRISQEVFDAFIADMDAGLREAGVGDQTVPKRIVKMTRVFYGRTGAYDDVFESGADIHDKLQKTIARNLYPDEDDATFDMLHEKITTLATYMNQEYRTLNELSEQDIINEASLFNGAPQLGESGVK